MKRNWMGWGLAWMWFGPVVADLEEVYLDADDGGKHAVVSAALEGGKGREVLVLRISPHGQGVEREGGWRSRDGFNAHTARELESVLRAGGFEARLLARAGGPRAALVAWEKTFGEMPRRRMGPDGSIDYLARSEPLVMELRLRTSADLAGTDALELMARGEARLRLEYDLAVGRLTGVAMPGHSEMVAVASLVAEQKQVEPMDLPGNWQERGPEGKWRWYRAKVGDSVEKRGRFLEAMRMAKDWTFLEQVALYSPGAYGTHGIGVILHEGEAPNWRRVVAWFGGIQQGHGGLNSISLLWAPAAKPMSLGWLNAHPERLDPNLLVWKARLEKEGVKPEEPDGDLPPLIEGEVFAGIAEALGDRDEPLAEAVVARVLRGIEGWAVSERWGSPWGEKVVDLIEDADWRIAQAACLAFTHGKTKGVPSATLWKVSQNGAKDQRLREAAFLAWSYGSWGEAFKVLHEVADEPGHALWMPAVSRLGELGNGWTLELFEELAERKGRLLPRLNGTQRRLLKQETEILRQRVGNQKQFSADFETTVWATVLGFDRSADMEEWMLSRYGQPEWDTEQWRKMLRGVRGWHGADQPPGVLKERLEIRKRLLDELEFRWNGAEE